MWWTFSPANENSYYQPAYNLAHYYQWRPNVPMAPPPPVMLYNPKLSSVLKKFNQNRYHGARANDAQSLPRSSGDSNSCDSSVGDYLTWEMAQYESTMTKLSQSSDELSNSTTSGGMGCRQQPQNGQQPSNRQYDTDSATSIIQIGANTSPTSAKSAKDRSPGAGAGSGAKIGANGNMSPMSSAGSTPRMYEQRMTVKPPGSIQRRHSAFQAGVKSPPDTLANEQIDRVLERLDNGVELAFARAKAWSKYCKEILNYVQCRIKMETDHAKNVQKLIENTQAAMENENFLPLQNVYFTSFKMEHEFFENCTDTMKRLYEFKYIKPLEARKNEQDRKRKELKAQWDRCNKQVQDAAMELKKSKQNFVSRENNYKKARENSVKLELSSPDKAKIDKRRKMEEDAMLRRQQAAEDVRSLETRLEEKYEELERMKVKILDDIRELIYQCDQTTKACTSAYFQALAGLWSPLPAQYQSLSESCRAYIPGMEYAQYIKQIPHNPESTRCHGRASSDDLLPSIAINGHLMFAEKSSFQEAIHKTSLHLGLSTAAQSSSSFLDSGDEASSINSYFETAVSLVSAASPSKSGKSNKVGHRSSISEAASTHRLQKVRMPTKCCHCDSYTFFQTVQCTECCMTWHKQCLALLEVPCDVAKRMVSGAIQRRMSTRIFGAPLPPDGAVPIVLRNCVSELEKRGCTVKGLYRVCGVKSKIEELCEQFERDNVDLSEVHPTNVASVAKLYLRQLPEPILTLKLYPPCIALAKDYPADHPTSEQANKNAIVNRLKDLVQELPKANFDTVKYLILHLHRLTWFESENQMSAGNLGIVFGPTLLRRDDGSGSQASLNSLLEAPLQTRAVELLIQHAYDVFEADPSEDMERLGITRRKSSDIKSTENNRRKLTRPSALLAADGHRNSLGNDSPRLAVDDDEMMPRRTSTTPDLLKGSRTAHERSMSTAGSSSSEFSPDSPDDSPERKASNGAEWRELLASAASREQRLHHALATVVRRDKSAPIGRHRRATSPGDFAPSVVTINDDSTIGKQTMNIQDKPKRPVTPVVPVASPDPSTPVSTPMVPDSGLIGSPFQRAKGIIVRRVSSNRKGLLVMRSTSSNSQGGECDDDHEIADIDDENEDAKHGRGRGDFDSRPSKATSALKRGSAPVLEKKPHRLSTDSNAEDQAKRKSQSIAAPPSALGIGTDSSNDRRPTTTGAQTVQDDLAYV